MVLQSQMRSFFETFPFPSILLNTDELFTLAGVNQAYDKTFGEVEKKEVIDPAGQSLFRFLPEQKDRINQTLNRVLTTKESLTTEIRIHKLASEDTEEVEIHYSQIILTPLLNDQGKVDHIICSFLPSVNHISEPNKLRKQAGAPAQQVEQNHHENPVLYKLRERIKEQSCLYKISNLNEQELSVEELLEQAVNILPEGWQHTDVAEAAIKYNDRMYATPGYRETEWMISSETEIRPGIDLTVKVTYLEQRPLNDEGPFLKEERNLIDSVINHLSLKLDQKLLQQELKEKQLLLDKAYQLARIGTWEFDMQTHELQWSVVTKEVHGFGPDYEPDLESTIELFKEGINRQLFEQAARNAIENETPFDVELKIVSGQGDERWIRATGEPEYKDGICTRFYGISQNVTDRKKAEEDLLLSEQRFRSLVQDGSDLIAILNSDAGYEYVSSTSESILGIPAEDLVGTNVLDYIHPDDRNWITEIILGLLPGQRTNVSPFRFRNSEGNWRWIETTLTNMTEDPAVGGLVANSRDVTEQKRQQQKNLEALKEKETLLAEIHHRVKNNLAVVSGMMQLQISDEDNEELTDRLLDSIIRIKTMANIHEQLYQSKSFSNLEFADNIRSLVLDIQKTLQSDTRVQISFDSKPVQLNINQAIPCSLIVNEVVTNIFKHAFTDRDEGNIYISLSESTTDTILQLSIKDDGSGLPHDFDETDSGSLGMNLVNVLSQQLGAEYRYESPKKGNGTTFSISFEKDTLKGIGNHFL